MKKNWITDKLPDDEITVLMRLDDDEYPIWPGFHRDDMWFHEDGSSVWITVYGWMDLNEASSVLDSANDRGESC